MSRRKIYYSFSFEHDNKLVLPLLKIDSNESISMGSHRIWDKIKHTNTWSIKKEVSAHMDFCQCVVVLIGDDTANNPLIKYEIKNAWRNNKVLMGIYIHNLSSGLKKKGKNPFCQFTIDEIDLCKVIKCYDPNSNFPLSDIVNNFEIWIVESLEIRKKYILQNDYL